MPQKQTLRIHLLVQDHAGPIHSGGMNLNTPVGVVPVGQPASYRVACDPEILLDDLNRGTGEPWAVRCADCFQTPEFQKINRPKPGSDEANARAGTVAAEDMTPPKPAPCPSC